MHFIGTALVFLGFLDFGLYLLGNVSSSQLSFIPEILVFDDKDFTGVAVVMIGYFLRESANSSEKRIDSESNSNTESDQHPTAAAPEITNTSNLVNAGSQVPNSVQANVASWGFIDSWLRNTLLSSLFATISGSDNWFYESPALRFFGRLFILALICLVVFGMFASYSE